MTADTVHQAAVDTLNAKNDVDGTLAGLKSLVETLADAWKGQGAVAFQNVMEQWNKESADLLEALQNIADMLDTSATATTEQDEESGSDFAGLL
ncbi:WXG100 family type VII secretion target [Glycomyces sp. A-F 0318]|uniref:WXG100 family type VII secretion target n=1 Tax=Glycomyces amatae TaxID=2881355 RepID=UPI001E584DA8|nr:WXG100 family type VII secretion target [Glycomyces amatae]MCD0445484.1 WXG100 family type VII secretion target [Glycomyces amatae]